MPPKKGEKGKKKIELSLYINKTPYKYGCSCTFCSKVVAILHCPECPDFFCKDCDVTAHSHKKREHHIRFPMSKLNLAQAATLITHYIRLVQHLRRCIARARLKFKRYFDKRTLNHYYFNTTYGTTSWLKPFCLRKEELFPFWEADYAASKIQNMYHLWKGREKVISKLKEYYRKVFDRSRGIFYYAWHGASKLLPKANWKAPKLCGKRGYPNDVLPIYTRDVACIVIQRKWRANCVRNMLCTLCRAAYDQLWDPVLGKFTYFHRETEILYQDKPKLLRGQPWDPNYINEWNRDQVKVFMRRIGLKQYAVSLYEYGIDGKTLILLDNEDFDNLNILSRVHRKKIQVEVEKRIGVVKRERVSEEHMLRREKIRKIKLFNVAAISIQARFRTYLARKEIWLKKELIRLELFAQEVKAEMTRDGVWWSFRDNIPSRDTLQFANINIAQFYEEKAADERRKNIQPVVKPPSTFDVLKNSKDDIKLPQINMKRFGRKADHETSSGWGRFLSNSGSRFSTLNLESGINMANFLGLENFTKFYTKRLQRKGYDKRRLQIFHGLSREEHGHHDHGKSEETKAAEEEEEEEEEEGDDEYAEEDAAAAKKKHSDMKEKKAAMELQKVQNQKAGRV